jgi:hypothetical protein
VKRMGQYWPAQTLCPADKRCALYGVHFVVGNFPFHNTCVNPLPVVFLLVTADAARAQNQPLQQDFTE